MRGQLLVGLTIFATFICLPQERASGQSVSVGVGASVPVGGFSDFGDDDGAGFGWLTGVGVGIPLSGNAVSLHGEGIFGSNGHEYDGDRTTLVGGLVGLEYSLEGQGMTGPFVFGQVGFLKNQSKSDQFPEHDASSSGLAFGGGAGYRIPLSDSVMGWATLRYLMGNTEDDEARIRNTTFVTIQAGVTIPIGG